MIAKKNYQLALDAIICRHTEAGERPTLVLHSCCAPCSSYVLEYLSRYFRITLVYYNPNIAPREEYARREAEQRRLLEQMPAAHDVAYIAGRYEPERFETMARGLEDEPEGGRRCELCYRMRMAEAARIAAASGADYFSTTLTISPLKSAQKINTIGESIAEETGTRFLPCDFKKRGGYLRSIALSREYCLYRQNFCGCRFSKRRDAGR